MRDRDESSFGTIHKAVFILVGKYCMAPPYKNVVFFFSFLEQS